MNEIVALDEREMQAVNGGAFFSGLGGLLGRIGSILSLFQRTSRAGGILSAIGGIFSR